MVVLGIESSCDETSASIVEDAKLLSNVVCSQSVHSKYGGVVPEIASREHLLNIIDVVNSSIKESGIEISNINGIAVTYGPGLLGALLVGLNFAKGLSIGLGIPFIGINHLEGHLISPTFNNKLKFPNLSILLTGGHTQIYLIKNCIIIVIRILIVRSSVTYFEYLCNNNSSNCMSADFYTNIIC